MKIKKEYWKNLIESSNPPVYKKNPQIIEDFLSNISNFFETSYMNNFPNMYT